MAQTFNSIDGARNDWKLYEDSTVLTTAYNRTWASANGGNGPMTVETPRTSTAGAHTYKLGVASSTGQASIYGDGTSVSFFEVILEDA